MFSDLQLTHLYVSLQFIRLTLIDFIVLFIALRGNLSLLLPKYRQPTDTLETHQAQK